MVSMTHRQCEIAGESYAACLLAQAGYDVLVQYGANQPHYDLVANKEKRFLPISVKGSQDGGWMLAVRFKKNAATYHDAINAWLRHQRKDVVYFFVQFIHVTLGDAPRVYIASAKEIASHLKKQCHGRGHGALHENYQRDHPASKYIDKIPSSWRFSKERMDRMHWDTARF